MYALVLLLCSGLPLPQPYDREVDALEFRQIHNVLNQNKREVIVLWLHGKDYYFLERKDCRLYPFREGYIVHVLTTLDSGEEFVTRILFSRKTFASQQIDLGD